MAATINELAARLNLSKGTVSRILNGKGDAFSAETRSRVLAFARELDYRPNGLARALATGRTGFIAVWLQHLMGSYYARVAHLLEAQIESHAYYTVIKTLGHDNWEGKDGDAGRLWAVDGIIAHEVGPAVQHWLGKVGHGKGRRPPIVTTGVCSTVAALDNVGVDLHPASREAVEFLVSTGRRRIAYFTHMIVERPGDARYDSYFEVLGASGLPREVILSPTDGRADARSAVKDYVARHGCPEAIFCHNDDLAIAAYRALCDMGISVPEDVALTGCDGIEDTEYLACPLSTIALPLPAVAQTAWRFLHARIEDPALPRQEEMLSARFVIRESSPA